MSLAVRIGGMLILLPLVLASFEVETVLVWQLQASILMMLVWIDFGFSPTFARFIALARGAASVGRLRQGASAITSVDDGEKIDGSTLIGTIVAVNTIMALLGWVLVALIGTWAIYDPILNLYSPNVGWIAWGLTLSMVPLMLLNGVNASILIGTDKITTLRRIETIVGLCQVTSNCLIMIMVPNLAILAASNTFWACIGFTANRYFARQALRDEGWSRGRADRSYMLLAWATGWRSGVGILFSTGLIQGSGLVIPQLASTETAAAYLLILRLVTLASQISQAPFYSRLPSMTKAFAEGDRKRTIQMAQAGMSLAFWTLTICLLGILFVLPPFLVFFGSSVQIPDQTVAILMSFAFFAERYGAMHMQIYTLSNHVIWHIINGITGLTMVLASVVLAPMLGVISIPVALLVAYSCFLCPTISVKALKLLQLSRWPFERRTSLFPLLMLLTGVGVSLVLTKS
jgi:O-antigen/teichoic acid export membrane protein